MKRIDTEAAAYMLGMTPNAFRVYAYRHPASLPRHGKDNKGRILYDLADVERVANARLAKAA